MVKCQECGEETGDDEIFVMMQSGFQPVIFFCNQKCHDSYFGQS